MRLLLSIFMALTASAMPAQTARKFSVNITPDGRANMTVYLPQQPTGRAVVDCPGGGYSHLSMQNEGHDWAQWFNQQGIAFCVLTYRMPNGDRSIPVGDAQQAIRTVRDSAALWGVNPYDVGIMGFSAGGHLASTVSTHSEYDCRPNFTILFYPVISMNERETHSGSVNGFLGKGKTDQKLVREFSSQNAVRRHLTPPAIILLANDDRAVPPVTNGIAYYSAMRRQGNECSLHVYPAGGHGFGFRTSYAFHDQMLADLAAWLNYHKAPRQDAVRVACIGNSITDGHGIDMNDVKAYPGQLQQLLGSGYQVRNCGVSARTLLNKGDFPIMKELAWRDALAFKPDVAVIKLGTNDSKPENWKHGREFESDLMQMIDQLCPMEPVLNKKGKPTRKMQRSTKTRIILCTPIPAYKPSWNISDSVITSEIIPVIEKVAQREHLQVVNLHALFNDNDGQQMQKDGIHPTEKGDAQIARAVYDAILKKK